MIKLSEKGVSIIEALVATVIIGIGFVAVFQMTQYSVRSIDVSGERTKATYLSGMIAEDLYAEKNEETSGTKFMDSLASTPWELKKCDESGTSDIPFPSFTGNHDSYKKKKWSSRFSRNFIKCRPKAAGSAIGPTRDSKKLNIFKICDTDKRTGCTIQKKNAFDTIYIGRLEVNMHGGNKKKILYFQVK